MNRSNMEGGIIPPLGTVLVVAIGIGQAIAKVFPTYRQCVIWIENHCKDRTLRNPRNYEDYGHCSEPLTPVIVPSDTGGGVFVKTCWATSGSVGVITYDIKKEGSGETKRLAVMYHVPYSFIAYSNWFAVGIFDRFTPCNQHLFNKMYYDSGPFTRGKASDGQITYKSDGITLKATMSDEYTPTIKLQIFD
uniref:Uncharacterized protein n=1 Tax=Sphaeramia orbicularis TaxID=375764 RepID=A0A672Y9N7_9TELE